MEPTEGQKWCASKADEAGKRGAAAVQAQLQKAAEHREAATTLRRVMGLAAKAARSIKGESHG